MQGRTAVLMANHGTLTYGDDLDSAMQRSVLLEWACTVYWQAAAIGTPRSLDAQQLAEVTAELGRRNYGSLLGTGGR